MSNLNDYDDELLILDRINNPVIPLPNSISIGLAR